MTRRRSRRPPRAATRAAPARPDPGRLRLLRGATLAAPALLFALLWFLAHDPRPSPGGDNLVYLLLARSLVEGRGLTEIHLPEAAPHTRYPFGFPLLLAPVYALSGGSLAALKLFVGAIGAASVVLAQLWLRRRQGDAVALAGALAVAASPFLLQFADDTFTEVPFLAATLLSLLLWERSADGRRTGTLAAALALALFAALVRLVGIALPVAYAVALARTSSPGRAAAAAAVAAAGIAGWAPSLLAGGGYGDELATRYAVVEAAPGDDGELEEVPQTLPGRIMARLSRSASYFARSAPLGGLLLPWTDRAGFLRILGGLAALAAALLHWGGGAVRVPSDPVPAYLLLTGGILFVWITPLERFLLPLLPFLLLAPLALARRAGARVLGALAAVLVLSALAGSLERVGAAEEVRAELERGNDAAGLTPATAQLHRAAEWTRAGLPAGTVVAARKPQLVFHYGGKSAVAYPRTSDPRAFARRLVESGADVLLADRETGAANRYLAPFVRAYGAELPLLYETGEPANTVVLGLDPLRQPGGLEPAARPSEWPPRTRMPDLDPTR